jgi:hypothetical protein
MGRPLWPPDRSICRFHVFVRRRYLFYYSVNHLSMRISPPYIMVMEKAKESDWRLITFQQIGGYTSKAFGASVDSL